MSVSPSKESEDVFSGCKSLTEIAIPSGVASIGEMAFYECEGLSRSVSGKGSLPWTALGAMHFIIAAALLNLIFRQRCIALESLRFLALR